MPSNFPNIPIYQPLRDLEQFEKSRASNVGVERAAKEYFKSVPDFHLREGKLILEILDQVN